MPARQGTHETRFALVLGGGGLRGLAHVGALMELEAAGWTPTEVIGTSIGALVGATWAAGFSLTDMESIALSLRRRDIFSIAHGNMVLKRMRAPALYRSEPLQNLADGLLGDATFKDLKRRLIIATVEINSGMLVYFGLPGLDHVRVADAVIASCSLPGFFPPREIEGRWFADGAVVDNMPVRLAATHGQDAVVGVDVSSANVLRSDMQEAGFAAVFARASEIVFQRAMDTHLGGWTSPPMLLVQPRVEHIPMFSFEHTREMITEGRRATVAALRAGGETVRLAREGIYPKRLMQLGVLRERCIGCGTCLSLSPPGTFVMDAEGKAVARRDPVWWSPVDGGFVRNCPTYAITAHPVGPEPAPLASTGGASTGTAPAPA